MIFEVSGNLKLEGSLSLSVLFRGEAAAPLKLLAPGLIILAVLLGLVFHFARVYLNRKKYLQALVLIILAGLSAGLYLPAGKAAMLTAASEIKFPPGPKPMDPGPPVRQYTFLKNHRLLRNRKLREIQAVDRGRFSSLPG